MKLEEKYVAFLDVLGFKEIVKNIKIGKNSPIEEYLNLINKWKEGINNSNERTDIPEIDIIVMSDSIVLSIEKSNIGLRRLILACHGIQVSFLKKNLYLRGAISFGELYFDKTNNLMIGMGLVNAFLLEKDAVYPRVLIDPKILLDLNYNLTNFMDEFKFSKREGIKLIHHLHSEKNYENLDILFIDYIERIIDDYIKTAIYTSLDSIYDNVYKNLYSSQSVFLKYHWLKKYILLSLKDYHYRDQHLSKMPLTERQKEKLELIIAKYSKM